MPPHRVLRRPAGPESFLANLPINMEPKSLYARYFLAADEALARMGVTLSLVPFRELRRVYDLDPGSWNNLPPWFDSRDTVIEDDKAAAFVGYDLEGAPVTAAAVRVWDLAGTTFKAEFESLRFLFGAQADQRRDRWVATATAPMAAKLDGHVLYGGSYWVRPDWRGKGIGNVVPSVVRYAALSRWNVGIYLTLGSKAFLAPALRDFYDFTDYQDGMYIGDGDRKVFNGLLLWARASHPVSRLEERYEKLRAALSTGGAGAERQPLAARARDGDANAGVAE